MNSITIASYTTTGVVLGSNAQNTVSITTKGTINASGSYSAAVYAALGVFGTILNGGTLMAAAGVGVQLTSGGTVINGGSGNYKALISVAQYGIRTGNRGPGTVVNYGTIKTTNATSGIGITLGGGGEATNGSASDLAAYIHCYQSGITSLGPNSRVYNYGTIVTTGTNNSSYGVYLRAGGTFTNGSNADTAATIITNARAVSAAIYQSTIVNYGTIDVTQQGKADAILLEGGQVVNGSSTDTSAYLEGAAAGRSIYVKGPSASTVVNYGIVSGGVSIRPGGTVVNGTNADTHARIAAATYGVLLSGPIRSVISNYGTIIGSAGRGVIFSGGGTLTNGSASDRTAYISGNSSAYFGGTAPSYVTNFGTIAENATSTSGNVVLMGGGTIVNGSSADTTASIIRGQAGIWMLNGASTLINDGTIAGTTAVSCYHLSGVAGVTMTGTGTIVNAGTIQSLAGTIGTAIRFGSGSEKLVVDPGSVVIGKVIGGSGSNTLELAAGPRGTLSGLGSSFTNFGTITVDSGAIWTLTGINSVASGQTLSGSGTLVVSGIFLNSGSVAGQMTLAAGATLANYGTVGSGGTAASFAGGGLLQVGTGAAFSGNVAGAGLTGIELLTSSTGTIIGFNGSSGTISTGGNSWSVSGMAGAMSVDRTANWTLSGSSTIGNAAGVSVYGTLGATSALNLAGSGTILVSGTNARLLAKSSLGIQGATLDPTGGGVVEVGALGTSVASQVVSDSGRTLSGYGTIAAPMTDNGTLLVQGGTLVVTGRVTGSGTVTIASGATLLSQTGIGESSLVFGGNNATVQVAKSTSIAATISGIGSGDTVDFLGTVANSLSFTGGKLRVIGAGGTIASLSFAGSYSAGNFALSGDGQGGTDLTTVGLTAVTDRLSMHESSGSGTSFVDLRLGLVQGISVGGSTSQSAGGGHGAAAASAHTLDWASLHQG